MISNLYSYFLYLIFALLPTLIWLVFYFKKDLHPEPRKMILRVFFLGVLAACFAGIFETFIFRVITGQSILLLTIESLLLVAIIEEVAKFLVVRLYVFSSPELDEPLDVMLYMVVSALGFAALENLVLFFSMANPYAIGLEFKIALFRFIGAVFLHTLTSGALGFFIAMAFYSARHKILLIFSGFFIAIATHAFYNIAITEFSGFWQYTAPAIIIFTLLIFTTVGFAKLGKLKSVCKI
jgi:protease PrsW